MAGNFTLASCMRRYQSREELEDPANSLHKCWSCKLAYGQCEWSRVDEKSGKVRFEDVPGWKIRRRSRMERDEVVDFTDSYATGVQVVIVKDGSDVTMDNLGEKMIGTQRGTTGYIYASDTPENGGYGEDHVLAYDNGATAVQALMNGQIDAVIIDEAPAKEFVAANEGLTILPGNWVEEQYCAAVDEGNTALQNAINTALNELIDDGTVDEIIAKYISAE